MSEQLAGSVKMLEAADFSEEMIREAKKRGISIIMDLVLNHSSDRHPWFLAAKADRESPCHDYYIWRDGTPEETGLYDNDYLGEKDKYSTFLGGNQPLCVIRNGEGTGKLLLIRDSYADSLAPFLARHFEEVHLLDLRYYRGAASAYAAENGIGQIVVLQSVPNFITDQNLALLGR